MELENTRLATADWIYVNFDFSYNVVDARGWEWTSPGAEMTKAVYFEDPEASGASITGRFTVRFESPDSAVPVEAFAIVNGQFVGKIGGGSLQDYMVTTQRAREAPARVTRVLEDSMVFVETMNPNPGVVLVFEPENRTQSFRR